MSRNILTNYEIMPLRGRIEVTGRLDHEAIMSAANELRVLGPKVKPAALEVNPVDLNGFLAGVQSFFEANVSFDRYAGLSFIRQPNRPAGTWAVRASPREGVVWRTVHPSSDVVMVFDSIAHPGTTVVSAFVSEVGIAIPIVEYRRLTAPAPMAWGRDGNWFTLVPTEGAKRVIATITLDQLETMFGPAPLWVDGGK